MVSVIITTINDPFLNRTIKTVRENASLPVEFIVINDGGIAPKFKDSDIMLIDHKSTLGRRVSINEAVQLALGSHLLILDAHCSMSKDWDVKMIESCKKKNLVYAIIRDMNPKTWDYLPGHYLHVRLNKDYTEKWWNRKPLEKCSVEEESMTITGCAWMVTKERYKELGGYDESLGKYGWDGPEWTCKIWMGDNPGRVLLRTDVVCGHIFGTNNGGKLYRCEMISKPAYVAYMKNLYASKIQALVDRFSPVPDWDEAVKGSDIGQIIKREVKINRIDEHVTQNKAGVVIKKVKEYFEYIYTDDGNGPSEDEITKKYASKAKRVKVETWELKNGKLKKIA